MKEKKETSSEKSSRKKIVIALQGGGSHGAFTWGVIDQLLEDGRLEIKGVSGTSAGGMNAVALAQGLMKGGNRSAQEELYAFWKAMSDAGARYSMRLPFSDYFPEKDNLIKSTEYLFKNFFQSFCSPYQFNPLNLNPLKDIVEEFFDFKKLHQFKGLKLFLCATHVASGKLKIFRMEDLCVEVLLASACLPTLFQAVEVKGEYYWDGGFVGNPAIYPLIYECETPDIMIIQLTVMTRQRLPMTAQQIMDRHKEITYNACLMREMRSINFISHLIDDGLLDSEKVKRLRIHLIRNDDIFSDLELSSAMDSDWKFLDMLYQSGKKTAARWLQENYDHIGVKTTAEIEKDFVD